jgi:[acyl-carrier-protein] S-malonyltransferase
VPVGVGAMAAILGMPVDRVREIASEAAQGEVCQAANINSPEQIVISGNTGAVARAIQLATDRGAKKAVSLPVSAPFHCALMQPAQDLLASDLRALAFNDSSCPVICNVDAVAIRSADAARDALVRQVTGAVRWEESVRKLIEMGAKLFIEVGPGKVLWGLMRQIDRSKTCLTVGDEASLQKALAQIAAPSSLSTAGMS